MPYFWYIQVKHTGERFSGVLWDGSLELKEQELQAEGLRKGVDYRIDFDS